MRIIPRKRECSHDAGATPQMLDYRFRGIGGLGGAFQLPQRDIVKLIFAAWLSNRQFTKN